MILSLDKTASAKCSEIAEKGDSNYVSFINVYKIKNQSPAFLDLDK